MSAKNWLEDPSVQEIVELQKQVQDIRLDSDPEQYELWKAIAKGRLASVFRSHPQVELLLQEFESIEYDPVFDEFEDDEGEGHLLYESDYLEHQRGLSATQVRHRQAWKYRHKCRKCLLGAITSLASELNEMPSFVTPNNDVSFICDHEMAHDLSIRWMEAYHCRRANLINAGTVVLVSFIEGLLGISFKVNLDEAEVQKFGATKDRSGNIVILPVEQWTLEMLFATGQKVLNLKKPHWDMLRLAQQHRNLIHPMKKQDQLSLQDLDSVWLSAHLVTVAAKDFWASRRDVIVTK